MNIFFYIRFIFSNPFSSIIFPRHLNFLTLYSTNICYQEFWRIFNVCKKFIISAESFKPVLLTKPSSKLTCVTTDAIFSESITKSSAIAWQTYILIIEVYIIIFFIIHNNKCQYILLYYNLLYFIIISIILQLLCTTNIYIFFIYLHINLLYTPVIY